MLFLSVAARLCLSTFAILHFWLILIIFFLMINSGIACCGRILCSLLLSVMTIAAAHAVSLCVARQSRPQQASIGNTKKILFEIAFLCFTLNVNYLRSSDRFCLFGSYNKR